MRRRSNSKSPRVVPALLACGLLLVASGPALAALDTDGDGLIDSVEAAIGTNPALPDTDADGLGDAVEFNTGSYGLRTVGATPANTDTSKLRLADLDGDGDLDVVHSRIDTGEIVWYENADGLGTFSTASLIASVGLFARGLHVADLDGDGDADVMGTWQQPQRKTWSENLGGGSFAAPVAFSTAFPKPETLDTADVDGDGDIDIVSGTAFGADVMWHENTDGQATFAAPSVAFTSTNSQLVVAADLNGDGDPDVLTGSYFVDQISWAANDGAGGFGPAQQLSIPSYDTSDIHATDIDGDGDLDVLVAFDDFYAGPDVLVWLENSDGAGSFAAAQPVAANARGGHQALPFDVDGDGDIDVVGWSVDVVSFAWYENTDGLGTFGAANPIAEQEGLLSVQGGDVDGDGDLDFVAIEANGASSMVRWLEREQLTDPTDGDTDDDGLNDGDEVLLHGTDPVLADSDGDGLNDHDEVIVHGSDPLDTDSDDDGLDDAVEVNVHGTSPLLADTDGDGLGDLWEVQNDLDPVDDGSVDPDQGAAGDPDGDALDNAAELASGTHPNQSDTDGDGLNDGDEVLVHGTNPLVTDTDGDGLSDHDEVITHGTDPTDADTDGDGLSDGAEVLTHGTSPFSVDTDGDGFGDLWEVEHGLDPLDDGTTDPAQAPTGDPDGDGLDNATELAEGTHPTQADSDSDGLDDGDELFVHGTNPLYADSDNDGLSDGAEVLVYGSNPNLRDSDGDLLNDAPEVLTHGTDPNDPDTDDDGLTDRQEVDLGTAPLVADTDGDALVDGDEVNLHGSDPLVVDTDADGLDDGDEVLVHGSDPTSTDTDDDEIQDGFEVLTVGTSPTLSDTDGDGLTDGWEHWNGLDPLDDGTTDPSQGAGGDPDGDGLDNDEEQAARSHPLLVDTDGDSLSDSQEVLMHLTLPGDADTDGDGLTDDDEIGVHGTDPLLVDTDGDGLSDRFEVSIGTGALDPDSDDDGLDDGVEFSAGLYSLPRIVSSDALRPEQVLAHDLDADGDLDLATSDATEISWYENQDGNASFGAKVVIATANEGALPITVEDLDVDGDPDLISEKGPDVTWMENLDGQGSFSGHQIAVPGDPWVNDAAAGDLDGDGDPDLIASRSFGLTDWYENDGQAEFATRHDLRGQAEVPRTAKRNFAVDLDRDGDRDVVAWNDTEYAQPDEVVWYENLDGAGTFRDSRLLAILVDYAIAQVELSDVDADGDLDVLLLRSNPSEAIIDEIRWLENTDGAGSFGPSQPIMMEADGTAITGRLHPVDLDGDGDLDLLFRSGLRIVWIENDGAGGFGPKQHIRYGGDLLEAGGAADLDGDGDLDVIGMKRTGDEVLWYEKIRYTDPLEPDGDDDGLLDGEEVLIYGTLPYVWDHDGDALGDGEEVNLWGTDPLLFDTDGDGFDDGVEVAAGSDPLDPAETPVNRQVPMLGGVVGQGLLLAALLASGVRLAAARRIRVT